MRKLNPFDHPICLSIPNRLTSTNSWHGHIPFAMFLADVMRPKLIVELGTHYGDSYCAFCQAVKDIRSDTRCYAVDTWKGDPQAGLYGPEVLSDLRAHHDPLYGSFSRLIQSTFDEALSHFKDGTIDILHIDGYHIYEMVKHDFETWLPKVSPNGIVLLHDINVLERDYGARRFWDEINRKYPHFEFLHSHGLGVLAIGKVSSEEMQYIFNSSGEEIAELREFFTQLGNRITITGVNQVKDRETQALQKEIEAKDLQLSELKNEVQASAKQLDEINKNLEVKNSSIEDLKRSLDSKYVQINDLNNQVFQMQHGILMQIRSRYQKIIDTCLGQGTFRRRVYQIGLRGIRVILNEGWSSFFRKANAKIRKRRIKNNKQIKVSAALKISDSELKSWAKKLSFPKPTQNPNVSIIIPAYNKWQYTVNCLKSIRENTEGDYEVIVVNDCSTDETPKLLSEIENLHFISNEKNSGFVDTCNNGAKASKGKYILFLNNDTTVTKYWLSSLLEIINKEDVGAVGSKLIYPDGTLQEAGSIVWSDGSALGYGRGDDPNKPEYNYLKEVDYCTGACLLVKKELFERMGGFDTRFRPGYYEETDLCFAVRKQGFKVMYQPLSVVVHFEGITNGTDVSSGIKKYQEINKPRFVEKWKTVLDRQYPLPTPKNILLARNRHPGKRILIIDDRIPVPSQGSGFPRASSMLKMIGELGYQVTFFPYDNPTPWEPDTALLQQLGLEVFYGNTHLNFPKFAESRAGFYDMVLVSRPHNMKATYQIIKRFFPNTTLIYDAEAMFSLREILKAKVKGVELKKQDAEYLVNDEINLIQKADTIITVSGNEKKIILDKSPKSNVVVWGHLMDIKEPCTSFNERKDILFVGGFLGTDSPNEDAIIYYAKEVFPAVSKELSCKLVIVGINPPDSVKRLASSSIIVAGYVKDIREYYEKCRIFIVPHRYSAGIPWKLQEAMSNGIPSVVSQLTAFQLDLTNNVQTLVAQNTDEFIRKTIQLYKNEQLWYQIQRSALDYIKETCNVNNLKISLQEVLQSVNQQSNDIQLKNQEIIDNKKDKFQLIKTFNQDEVIHYLKTIEKNDDREKQYFGVHEKRFYETLQLASKVLTAQSKVLDIGSHPASVPTLIKKYIGSFIYCCGLNESYVKVTNMKFGDEFYFHVETCDAEKKSLPYQDNSFDLVLCCEVLEHLATDPMFMISEVNRILKYDGYLLLTTPNLACLRSVKGMLEAWYPYLMSEFVIGSTDRHQREYTIYEVKHLLECGGFEVINIDTKDVWGGFDPVTMDMLKKLGKTTDFRGDDTFALAQKKTSVLDRYPIKFYTK